jgi:CTP synthase
VKYARENNLPFFGICLGMQMSVIEFGRNVLHLEEAHSTEMNPSCVNAVIDLMEEQKKVTAKGGTMRLGSYPCAIEPGSLAEKIYGTDQINERHRHRWEFNNAYLQQYHEAGMIASGKNPESNLVEIIELKNHPFFIGVQYHPELKSTVENPHPIFVHFVKASKDHADKKSAVKNPLLQSEMI